MQFLLTLAPDQSSAAFALQRSQLAPQGSQVAAANSGAAFLCFGSGLNVPLQVTRKPARKDDSLCAVCANLVQLQTTPSPANPLPAIDHILDSLTRDCRRLACCDTVTPS
jgi:hypothetical protein